MAILREPNRSARIPISGSPKSRFCQAMARLKVSRPTAKV